MATKRKYSKRRGSHKKRGGMIFRSSHRVKMAEAARKRRNEENGRRERRRRAELERKSRKIQPAATANQAEISAEPQVALEIGEAAEVEVEVPNE